MPSDTSNSSVTLLFYGFSLCVLCGAMLLVVARLQMCYLEFHLKDSIFGIHIVLFHRTFELTLLSLKG
jgi:hypothetical protein